MIEQLIMATTMAAAGFVPGSGEPFDAELNGELVTITEVPSPEGSLNDVQVRLVFSALGLGPDDVEPISEPFSGSGAAMASYFDDMVGHTSASTSALAMADICGSHPEQVFCYVPGLRILTRGFATVETAQLAMTLMLAGFNVEPRAAFEDAEPIGDGSTTRMLEGPAPTGDQASAYYAPYATLSAKDQHQVEIVAEAIGLPLEQVARAIVEFNRTSKFVPPADQRFVDTRDEVTATPTDEAETPYVDPLDDQPAERLAGFELVAAMEGVTPQAACRNWLHFEATGEILAATDVRFSDPRDPVVTKH